MGILSINLSSSMILLPQIQTLRVRGTPPTMCLKHHHNNNNNKLKLMVNHSRKGDGYPQYSLLSTEKDDDDDDHNCVTYPNDNPCFGYPFASCHELVLRRVTYQNDDGGLALWNPSTNEVIKTLPQPPRPPPSVEYDENVRLYGFGLDPTKSSYSDYKVLRDLDFEYDDTRDYSYDHLTELYSLKTDSWKHIACPHDNFVVLSHPIDINGFNYWPLSTGIGGEDFKIISFDFANECFPSALIPGPCAATYKHGKGFCGDDPYEFLLAEYQGSLAVVVYVVKDKLFELWLWNNDFDNPSWSRRGEWTISPISGGGRVRPLGLYKNDQFYFQDSAGDLVLFDCAKQKLKNFGLDDYLYKSMCIFPY